MKTIEKVNKLIGEACKTMNDNDVFLSLYRSGRNVRIAITGDDDTRPAAMIAFILDRYYRGDAEEGEIRLAEIIIKALQALVGIKKSSESGVKFMRDIAKASLAGILQDLDDVSDADDDDDENCEECENNKTCHLPQAIAYRKANGIPKPNKGKKGGRKVDVN